MDDKEYDTLYKFEQFYWWHVGRRDIFRLLLANVLKTKKSRILEVGCGTGGNVEVLRRFGDVTGLDASEQALAFCKDRGFENVVLGRAEHTNLPSESFDVVAAFDVLEHIEDNESVLREAFRLLKHGGYFLATVPAYQFLWSEHDEALGHMRRYMASDFSKKVESAGFRIIKSSYAISFAFPLVLIYRLFRRIFFPSSKKNTAYVFLPKPINSFFSALLRVEAWLLQYMNFPFGTSVVCLAQKRAKDMK